RRGWLALQMSGSPKLSMKEDDGLPSTEGDDSEGSQHSGDWNNRNSTSSKRVTSPITLGSEFILSKAHTVLVEAERGPKRYVSAVLRHPITGNCLGLLTLFDAYLSCADIDRRAAGFEEPDWLSWAMDLCLLAYSLEYCMWCYVKGLRVLRDKMLVVDLLIILCGIAELLMSRVMDGLMIENFNLLRMFRIARIIRLLKLFRRFSYLKELRKLLTMATTCMRTLCWSFIFCFMVMTIWAMLLVDLVQPLILKLHEETHVFMDCEQCLRAASSVMDANLLLFKTVIAGDSWGTIAIPVIEAYPGTAFIFVGSLLTLVFGVLNLIVAVVVDTFAEARERDVLNLAE
ncbi:unnamed protein product, partial [Effrenium voratum]